MKMSFRIIFPKASWDLSLGFLEKLTYLGFPPFFWTFLIKEGIIACVVD